ncbi:hypothetical protein AERO8C_140102 [Aeromonas veronii]|uniref:Uncharacterized protein n=1 Tax=Aeromonas veronii TaxID=654 RepID=A0A653KTQ9_AERVE|nr:hypothetical protein AERO8C_140102 [Aeromonas veronii]
MAIEWCDSESDLVKYPNNKYYLLNNTYILAGQGFLFMPRQVSCGANSVKQEKG